MFFYNLENSKVVPINAQSVFVQSIHRNNLKIIEVLLEEQEDDIRLEEGDEDLQYAKYIGEEALYTAVNAAMKANCFEDYVIF